VNMPVLACTIVLLIVFVRLHWPNLSSSNVCWTKFVQFVSQQIHPSYNSPEWSRKLALDETGPSRDRVFFQADIRFPSSVRCAD